MPEEIQSPLSFLFSPHTYVGKFIIAGIILLFAILLGRLAHIWTRRAMNHQGLLINKTSYKFVGQLIQIAIFLFAATIYAQIIPEFQQLGLTFLASASILSLVVGFAAQSTIANLMAGIAILIYKPFNAGQVISIVTDMGKETGTVKDFNFGYTTLVTEDGRTILAPNSIVVTCVLVRVQ